MGQEKKEYKTPEEITDLFVEEFVEKVPQEIDAGQMLSDLIRDGPDDGEVVADGAEPEAQEKKLLTPEEMADPVRTLRCLKFVVGVNVIQKDNPRGIYVIKEVGSSVHVQTDCPLSESNVQVRTHVCYRQYIVKRLTPHAAMHQN